MILSFYILYSDSKLFNETFSQTVVRFETNDTVCANLFFPLSVTFYQICKHSKLEFAFQCHSSFPMESADALFRNVREHTFLVSSRDPLPLKYLCHSNVIDFGRKIASYHSYDAICVPVTDLLNLIHKNTIPCAIFDDEQFYPAR